MSSAITALDFLIKQRALGGLPRDARGLDGPENDILIRSLFPWLHSFR